MGSCQRIPKRRLYKRTGAAVVTLEGKDFYLGPFDSEESRETYDRVVAEWLANGRRLPAVGAGRPALTVGQVILRYWEYAEGYYGDGSGKLTPELYHNRKALRVVRRLYSLAPAEEFGPLALEACREQLIEEGLKRRTINQHVGRIKRMWRWAVKKELVPASVFHGLQAVEGLKRGRSAAKEGSKVGPVPKEHIAAVLERVCPTVRAMIEVHLLTAMRPSEVVIMRGCDIDRSAQPWRYRPAHHKTEHLGHDRVVYVGPRAQRVLEPLLEAAGEGYVFSPKRGEEARNARRKLKRRSRMTPSQSKRKRKSNRKRGWRECYDKDSYRRAIERACVAAKVPKWTPLRLRKNGGTRVRDEFGLDVAQALLGHKGADVTQLYAELKGEKAAEAAMAVG